MSFAKSSQRGSVVINAELYGRMSRDELGALFEKFMPLGEATHEDYGWLLKLTGISKDFASVPSEDPTPEYMAVFHKAEGVPVTVRFERR